MYLRYLLCLSYVYAYMWIAYIFAHHTYRTYLFVCLLWDDNISFFWGEGGMSGGFDIQHTFSFWWKRKGAYRKTKIRWKTLRDFRLSSKYYCMIKQLKTEQMKSKVSSTLILKTKENKLENLYSFFLHFVKKKALWSAGVFTV